MFSRLLQRRRERAALAELLKLNAPRMLGLVLEVADAQQSPAGDFVACLDGTKPLVDALSPIAKDLMAALDSPEGKAALESVVGGFTSILGAVKAAWPLVKEFTAGLLEGLAPLKEVGSGFMSAIGPILKVFGVDSKDAASGARLLGQALAVVIGGAALLGGVIAGVVTLLAALGVQAARQAWAIGEFAMAVVNWIVGIPGRISAFVGNFFSQALTLGTSIIDGMVAGITGGLASVISAVKNVASSAITTAKTTLGIASPSKEFAFLGAMSAEGFERGLELGTGGVVTASSQMATGAAGAAAGLGGGGGSLTLHMPVTIEGAGKSAPEIVDELQHTFMANLAAAFRQLQAEAGA